MGNVTDVNGDMPSMVDRPQHESEKPPAAGDGRSFGTPPEELTHYAGDAEITPQASPAPWGARIRSAVLRWVRRKHGRDSASAPFPPTASIDELGLGSDLLPVPPALRIYEQSEKGQAEIFIGREETMAKIEKFLRQRPTANSAFALLLTNAPGSGKSTIIDELRFRRARSGQPLIQIEPGAFLSEQALLSALKDTDLWQRSLGNKAVIWAATRGVGLLGWLTETRVRLWAIATGAPVKPVARFRRWQRVADHLHELTRREPPTTVKEAMQAVDRACRKGWIIAVDECGFWDDHQDNETVRTLLYRVADPTKRQGSDLAHGGLLLCGLSNAQRATDRLTLSRAKIERLPPLNEDEVRLLIRTHLERAGSPPAITERWTEVLTRDFSMWTQHAQRAASVAAEMIERTYTLGLDADTRERTWDHRLQLVRQQTAAQIVALYGRIAAKAQKLIGARATLQLAEANRRTDGCIPHEEFRQIIDAGLARGQREKPQAQGDRAVERDLMGMGLLHEHETVNEDQSESTWSIPMGSLTTHILVRVKDNEPPDDSDVGNERVPRSKGSTEQSSHVPTPTDSAEANMTRTSPVENNSNLEPKSET